MSRTVRLPTGIAFTFPPECCSESQRNGVQLQTGIVFTFDRIPHRSGALAWASGNGHAEAGERVSCFGGNDPLTNHSSAEEQSRNNVTTRSLSRPISKTKPSSLIASHGFLKRCPIVCRKERLR